jgi:hypothetical protein
MLLNIMMKFGFYTFSFISVLYVPYFIKGVRMNYVRLYCNCYELNEGHGDENQIHLSRFIIKVL